ncbi:spore coat polysaccharide biosynthesis protein SpsF [Fundidesulfovibrio butyratiphilus]
MRPTIVIQARMGSTRLPGKVLAPLEDFRLLEWVVHRCSLSRAVAGIVLATSDLPADDPLEALAATLGLPVHRGNQHDVLDRYLGAATMADADPVIRITGDCPLIDPQVIDQTLALFSAQAVDYACIDGYPRGLGDVEVFRLSALRKAHESTSPADTYYREHVTTFLVEHPNLFSQRIDRAPRDLEWPEARLCVDEPDDLEAVRMVCRHFAPRKDFDVSEIVALLRSRPDIVARNASVRQKTR